ncbi:MAG: helix-turn-helix domain-containing protein, partial [Halomonas sp.]
GNVRELENAIMRAVTLSEDGSLNHTDLPERLRVNSVSDAGAPLVATLSGEVLAASQVSTPATARWPSLEEVEKRYINKVLEATGGNKRRTAEVLGIARRTLYRRLEDNEE